MDLLVPSSRPAEFVARGGVLKTRTDVGFVGLLISISWIAPVIELRRNVNDGEPSELDHGRRRMGMCVGPCAERQWHESGGRREETLVED